LAKEFDPWTSAIYALNDIEVKAPAEAVWKLLRIGWRVSHKLPRSKSLKQRADLSIEPFVNHGITGPTRAHCAEWGPCLSIWEKADRSRTIGEEVYALLA